ncbi:hypothetical protein NLI96_g601 [Meripilus lineatus]|uniref:Uncharacterized protein n=1 Tax=Meripilus lineatus TaxID=2056292 RepID=A0AAD5VG95_9APHY|nr:hypothetical protein NLI96_g601 [Physisporinus lineatus]
MTEYTISSEAIKEYMSARERTAYWVQLQTNPTSGDQLLHPSAPPSILTDSDAPSYGPSGSDAGSSHSLPPRMVLRYDDGRPDVPIPHPSQQAESSSQSHSKRNGTQSPRSQDRHSPHQSRHSSSQGRSRAGSSQSPSVPQPPPTPQRQPQQQQQPRYEQTLSYVTVPVESIERPRSPESIVILPSRESGDSSQRSPINSVPINSRSMGNSHAPSSATSHAESRRPATSPGPNRHGDSEASSQRPRRQYNRPPQTPPPSGRHRPTPPSESTQTTSQSSKSRHRAPSNLPSEHSRYGSHRSGAHSSQQSPSTIFEEEGERNRSASRGRGGGRGDDGRGGSRRGSSKGHGRYRGRSPTPSLDSDDDARSDASAGTYYVLPTPGQKVQIIVPNSGSVYTATSTTKSAHSPQSSQMGGPKKPFFQRIFHTIPKLSSYGSSDSGRFGSRRLQRRHTIGEPDNPQKSENNEKRT